MPYCRPALDSGGAGGGGAAVAQPPPQLVPPRHAVKGVLATLGSVVHDVAVEPGYAKIVGGAKLTAAHDAFIQAADAGNKSLGPAAHLFLDRAL